MYVHFPCTSSEQVKLMYTVRQNLIKCDTLLDKMYLIVAQLPGYKIDEFLLGLVHGKCTHC